ncbi:MAG TPA: GNAT family N-acetyltransferase [Dermatophilaceae bacterium]|nr:GNAT family N-acetyltransferase [Dermatophilaceae bacterium]
MPTRIWISTPRLVLRRPRPEDLSAYVRLHTDPRTYAHAPQSMPDEVSCRERLDNDLRGWAEEGVGYAAVLDRASGSVIGWAGLRVVRDLGEPHLNLYYRLAHDQIGKGLGREIARAVAAWWIEHRVDLPLSALVDQGNDASLRTSLSAGLSVVDSGPPGLDGAEALAMTRLLGPTLQVVDGHAAPVEDLLDLWTRVNDAGGAVGFLPGTSREIVRPVLDGHLGMVRAGDALLVTLRDPDSCLRGFGFWHHTASLPFAHVAVLKRLMVDPDERGRNLGRLLLAGMVGVVRRDLPLVEVLRLDYRSGLGLGAFYAARGWTEVGRIPRGLWLGGEDYRDDVAMVRRVDGGQLTADGRT